MRTREACTSWSCRRTSTRRRAISTDSAAAARMSRSEIRRSSSAGSCSSTAVRSPSRVISECARPSSGNAATSSPDAVAYVSLSGSQNTSSASGSRSASREHPADLLGRPESLAHLVLELLDDAQALEASTVEAAVDDALDARPQRAERERDDERPGSGDPVRAAADRDARRERDADVRRREQQRQRAVDGGPVDQALDRVQPVAGHGDADGDREHDRQHRAGSGPRA